MPHPDRARTLLHLCLAALIGLTVPAFSQSAPPANPRPELAVSVGHSSDVCSVALSSNGELAVTGGDDKYSILWYVPTGTELRRFHDPGGVINFVGLSSDGRVAATCGSSGKAYIWDTSDGRIRAVFPGYHALSDDNAQEGGCAFSADGQLFYSTDTSGKPALWNVSTKSQVTLADIDAPKGGWEPDGAGGAAFSADGKLLAASVDGRLYLWSTTGTLLWRSPVGETDNSVAISPDARRVLVSSSPVKAYNITDGSLACTYDGDSTLVMSVAYSPDGKLVADGTWGYPGMSTPVVRLWSADGTPLGYLPSSATVTDTVFNNDGNLIITSRQTHLRLLNLASGKAEPYLETGRVTSPLTVGMTGQSPFTLSSATDYSLFLWKMGGPNAVTNFIPKRRALTKFVFPGHAKLGSTIISPSFLPYPESAAYSTASGLIAMGTFDAHITIWKDTDDHSRIEIGPLHPPDNTNDFDEITSIKFSQDGRKLIAFGQEASWIWRINPVNLSQKPVPIRVLLGRYTDVTEDCHYAVSIGVIQTAKALFAHWAANGSGERAVLWDISKRLSRPVAYYSSNAESAKLALGGRRLIICRDAAPYLVSYRVGDTAHCQAFNNNDGKVNSFTLSPNGRYLLVSFMDSVVRCYDVLTGDLLARYAMPNSMSVMYVSDDHGLAYLSEDGRSIVHLLDLKRNRELASVVTLADGTWIVADPLGRFDTNNIEGVTNVNWLLKDDPYHAYPLELFMRQYYEPRLLPRLLAHDPSLDRPVPSIADLNRVQPPVHITQVVPHPGDDPALVDVTVTASHASGDFHQEGQDVTLSTGVYDLRLFRNGQLVGALPARDEGATPVDLTADAPGGTLSHTFTVRLPRDGAKTVAFSAYAFNVSQVKSETDRVTYTLPTPLPVVKGNAYVVSMGVNSYQDPRWDLRFAANDARRTVNRLTRDLTASGRFAHVYAVPLVSDDATGTHDATRAALRAVLERLAGHTPDPQALALAPQAAALPPARPEDLVVLTFSCHGDNDPAGGRFYLFPADIGPDQEHGLTDDLMAHAVSSDDLSAWLQDVDAGQIALVVDACHSAASVDEAGFKPGPMGSRGLGQLAYDKGMRVLAASQADDVAIEDDQIGDGLLTYALVHDGLTAGRADADPHDGRVTLTKWLRYGVDRVPSLYKEVEAGRVDTFGVGAARAIPLGRRDIRLSNGPTPPPPPLQQPALFDFNRQAQDPVLEVLPQTPPR